MEVVISDAVDEFISAKIAANLRHRSVGALRISMGSFRRFIGEKTKLHEVTTERIRSWIYDGEKAAATRDGLRTDIRNFCNWCVKRGYMTESPAEPLDPIIVDYRPPGILTVDQCRRVMAASLDEKIKGVIPFMTLALFCGIRPHEILRLTWGNVDMNRAIVTISGAQSKVRERRIVPIQPNAIEWLKLGGDLPPTNWEERRDVARKISGIPWPHDCMRHSYASYRMAIVKNAHQVCDEMGNSPDILLRDYRELVLEEDAKMFWLITPESVRDLTIREAV
jgi:integrase